MLYLRLFIIGAYGPTEDGLLGYEFQTDASGDIVTGSVAELDFPDEAKVSILSCVLCLSASLVSLVSSLLPSRLSYITGVAIPSSRGARRCDVSHIWRGERRG